MHRRELLLTASRPKDPLRDAVVLHLEFEGQDGATKFVDLSKYGAVPAVSGVAVISHPADQVGIRTGGAMNISTTGSHGLQFPNAPQYNVSGQDFSIEWDYTIAIALTSGGQAASMIYHRDDTSLRVFFYYDGNLYCQGTSGSFAATSGIVLNARARWHLGRRGSTYYAHKDGALIGSGAGPAISDTATAAKIGRDANTVNTAAGWFDRFRFTVGACRYTESYSPASAPFPLR